MFRPWQLDLSPSIEVCPLRLPGREMRWQEPPISDFAAMVVALDQALAPYLHEPYALLGHSMGASLVYELAVRLAATGRRPPEHMFVAARQAPHLVREVLPGPVATLSDAELLHALAALNPGTHVAIDDPELAALVLPTLRADFALCQSYVPVRHAPLAVPFTVLGGVDDVKVGLADLAPWALHTSREFTLRFFPGDHFSIVSAGAEVRRFVEERLAVSA